VGQVSAALMAVPAGRLLKAPRCCTWSVVHKHNGQLLCQAYQKQQQQRSAQMCPALHVCNCMCVLCPQLLHKVLVEEHQRLISTEQHYLTAEDEAREQACLAKHGYQAAPTRLSVQVRCVMRVGWC
jgi:hypothetical protein